MATDIRDLEEAWRAEPGNPETFSALAGRYIIDGKWRKLVTLFDEGADELADDSYGENLVRSLQELEQNASEARERGRILVAIGDAAIRYLDDRERAMKAYQTSFKTYPQDTTCLDRARAIYRRTEDYERIFLLHKLELKVKTDPEPRASVLINMAQVRGDQIGDQEGALQILDEALKLTPDNSLAQDLKQIYSEGGTYHGKQLEIVEDAEEAREAGELEMAAELLALAASFEEQREAGTLDQAIEYVTEAHELDEDNQEIEDRLGELLHRAGRDAELDETGHAGVARMAPVAVGESSEAVEEPTNGQAAESMAEPAVDDGQAAETQRIDIAQIEKLQEEDRQVHEQSDVSEAEVSEAEVSEAEVSEAEVSEAEVSEAEVSEAEESEVSDAEVSEAEVSEAEESEVSGAEESEISEAEESEVSEAEESEVSEVSEAEESEAEEAAAEQATVDLDSVDGYVAALSDDPTNLGLLRGLYDAASEEGDWDTLVEQYERSLKRLRKQEGELETMVRLAQVLWKEVGDIDRAEYYFKRVKLLDSEHADMLDFYESYFEDRGEWRKLFAMLSTAAQNTDDDDRRARLTERQAEIAEHNMDSPEKAIDVWKSFLRAVPGDDRARSELRRLYEQNGKWSALVDFFKEDLHTAEDEGASAQERIDILRQMAEIYDVHLGLEPMVINTLQEILQLDPADEESFNRLRELLVSNRRMNDLAGLLNGRAEEAIEAGDINTASEYLVEVATIWMEELKNVTQALPYLERVLEIDPDNQPVREKLKAIYEKRRDYASLFDIQYGEVKGLEGDEKLTRLRDLVELAIDRIRDPALAVPVLHEILEMNPGDAQALDRLEFIHRRRDEYAELADVLVLRAEYADDSASKVDYLNEAAAIFNEQLGEGERARELWKQVLQLDPGETKAMGALTRAYVENLELDELDTLYRERDALDQLYDLLDSAAATAESLDVQRAVYRQMATLAENDLGAPDRVIISLESLLEIAEDRGMVARELIRWYQEVGDVGREIEMNRLLLDSVEDRESHLDTLERLRELEAKRDESENALEWALKALRAAPRDTDVAQRAEELAREVDALDAFLQTLEDIAEVTDDDELQESLWARIGEILRDDLQAYDTAVIYFERLHERHPTDLEWLEALEALYDQVDEREKRIAVLREQIDVLKDGGASDADVVDEYRKIADVQRQMGDPDAARETYAEILDIEPDHLGALRGIREIYRAEERWEDVVDVLLREQSLVPLDDEAAQVQVLLELADVNRLHMGQPEEALRNYGQVLALVPDQEDAVNAVESLLTEPDLAREAALMLEPIFRDSEQLPQLVRALEARFDATEDRFEKAEILDELIPIYMEAGETSTAFDRACRQFELDPDRSEIWLRLEQLGASLDRWEDLEQIFSRFKPEDKQAHPTRFDLLKHLASIREYKLDMPEGALEAWEQLHDYDPMDEAAMEALDRLYRQLGHHDRLVDVLDARAEVANDPEQRVKLLMEAARIADEVTADTERTIELYRKVLLAEPEEQRAVEGLRSLLYREERWVELEELLAGQADFASEPQQRRDFQLELARIRWEKLGDYQSATDLVQQLLSNDPSDEGALQELHYLDARLAEEDRGQLRLDLAAVAEPIYRDREDWGGLIEVLRTRLEHTDDPFDQVSLMDELAQLYIEHAADGDAAFDMVAGAVKLSPDDEERRELLEALGDEMDRVDDVLTTLAYAADNTDSYVAADLFRRMGELYRDRKGLYAEAIACFEHALEQHSTDEELLAALGQLYEQVEDHEKLAANLKEQSIYGDPDRRAEYLRRIGIIETDILDRTERAIEAYEELLETEPQATDAMSALEMLYDSEGRWVDLCEILSRQANAASDPEDQIVAWSRLASVQEQALEEPQSAIDTYRQILSVDPQNQRALNNLERLHEQESQWAELSEVFRAKLNLPQAAEDPNFRNQIELRLADVLSTELYAADEALGLYRGVLERDPGNEHAIASLERIADDETYVDQVAEDLIPHYIQGEQWQKLVDLYDRLQERTHDPELRSDYYFRIAQVQRDGLGDLDAAIDALANAWKLDVAREELHDQLLSMVAQSQDWRRLAEIYRDVLVEVTDPDRMLELRLLLASLYYEQIGDMPEAELQYREALAVDERNGEAYSVLESILTSAERWHDLVELLESKFAALAVDDPEKARQTLHRIAGIQDEFLEDGFSAVDTYNRILEIEPTDRDAQASVEALFRRQERWEDLRGHLIRRIEITSEPEEIVELKAELASLSTEHLHDPLGALDLYREVLELEPDHEETLHALQQIFESREDFRADAGKLLEPVLRRHELWDNLVIVLTDRASNPDFRGEAPALLREVGQIALDEIDDVELAVHAYERLFELEPSDEDVRGWLHDLTARSNDWESLAELYQDVLEENFEISDDLRIELLAEQASLYEERLEQLEPARETYEQITQIDPENEGALDALDRIYSRQMDWTALGELYRRRADVTLDPDKRVEWLDHLANLREEILDDIEGAIDVYNEIIQVDPSADRPRRILERLLRQAQRWHDLASLFREQADSAEDDEARLEHRFRLAQLLEAELEQIEEALELYREILAARPEHFGTRRALEGLLRDLALEDRDTTTTRMRIIDLLLEVYDPERELEKYVDLLEQKGALAEDVPTKTEINHEIADLLENSPRQEDRIRGMMALANAYRVDPMNEDLKRRVNNIAMDTETWDKLIPLYLGGLKRTNDPDIQVHLLNSAAEVYSGPLSDLESALTAYQQVIEIMPDNEKALSQLEKLYGELELWEPLVDTLLRRVDVVYDADLQERLLRRVARIREEILAEPAAAVEAMEQLRELDPSNLDYVSTLQRLYEDVEMYEELEELLRLKVGLLEDEEQQLKALRNLARVQDEALGRPNEAIDSYRSVLAIDEEDVDAVKALNRLYGRTEQWPELLEMLRIERDFAGGLDELNAVELRMGIVLAERLGAGQEAIEKFNQVLERDPQFGPARQAMRKLLGNPETGEQVQIILESLFREQQEWNELEKLYESLLNQTDTAERRKEAYLKLGALQENELDNLQMAFITYGRATRENPGEQEYRANLERLAGQLDSWGELLAVYEDCIEQDTVEPTVALWLHNRLGRLYFDMEEFDAAIEHYQAALEIDEYDATALKALDDLFQIVDDWEALAGILERELAVVEPDEVNDARYRLGHLNEVRFGKRERALDLYAQILVDEPGHINSIDAMERLLEHEELRPRIIPILEPILIELGEHQRLVQMYGMQLELLEDPIDRSQVLEKIANRHLDYLDNLEIGYAYLSRALRADPGNSEVQIRLEALVDTLDMHEELVALYEEIMEDLDDPIRTVELALVAGTISYGTLDDVERAWGTFERVLELDHENEAALAAMEEIARDEGDPQSLAAVLGREADIVFEPDQRLRILNDLGDVNMELERWDAALDAFQRALEIDESSVRALDGLVEVLEITENYEELVEVMQRLVMFESDPDKQFRLYVRIGRYARVLLDDTDRAIEAYRSALGIDPDDDEVLAALEELFEETEDWDRLRKVVSRRIRNNDEDTAVSLYLKLADISHTQFNEVERAIEEYDAALQIAPTYKPTIEALGQLYRDEERWAELLAMYERVLAATPSADVDRTVELQVEMADISAKYLGDEDKAITYLQQILESDPEHLRALAVLADLYGHQGDWERGLKVMERRMKACRTREDQIEALMHRARIYADELNRPRDAANDYVRVVELEPLHEEALSSLKHLYGERLQAHKAMYDILKYEASNRASDETKLELYEQMADIARDILGDVALTIEALELAYGIVGDDLEIVEPLLDAYISGGEIAKAEPLLESIIKQLRSDRKMKDVVRFQHLQGKLAEQKGDLDAAYEAYDAAHKVDASYIPNLLSLGKLLYQREEWEQALKIFQTLLLHQMNIEKDSDKVDIYYHLGMVRWHQGDARRAKDMFNRALNIDANHAPSQEAISQL